MSKHPIEMPDFPGRTVGVELGSRSYPIYIGSRTLAEVGTYIAAFMGQTPGSDHKYQVVIITDENVGPLYGSTVLESIEDADLKGRRIDVPAGEKSKSSQVLESIYEKLFDFEIQRTDAIVALGGGVIGDLAGFAAASFKRGVNLFQIPTSLLAMVDSGVGGKTGINHPRGKNMIGAFYQPRMVYTDTAVLKTLPERELGCGLAESVKHAVIRDEAFFDYLEKNVRDITELQNETMTKLVEWNCRIKAAVVAEDERESGLRGILNLGHTIGHTLETVLPERDFHHGEAVSLGMVAAGRLALARNHIQSDPLDRMIRLLQAFHLPTSVQQALPADRLYQAMKQDKKIKQGQIHFVLPVGLGNCVIVKDITEKQIKDSIDSLLKNK